MLGEAIRGPDRAHLTHLKARMSSTRHSPWERATRGQAAQMAAQMATQQLQQQQLAELGGRVRHWERVRVIVNASSVGSTSRYQDASQQHKPVGRRGSHGARGILGGFEATRWTPTDAPLPEGVCKAPADLEPVSEAIVDCGRPTPRRRFLTRVRHDCAHFPRRSGSRTSACVPHRRKPKRVGQRSFLRGEARGSAGRRRTPPTIPWRWRWRFRRGPPRWMSSVRTPPQPTYPNRRRHPNLLRRRTPNQQRNNPSRQRHFLLGPRFQKPSRLHRKPSASPPHRLPPPPPRTCHRLRELMRRCLPNLPRRRIHPPLPSQGRPARQEGLRLRLRHPRRRRAGAHERTPHLDRGCAGRPSATRAAAGPTLGEDI